VTHSSKKKSFLVHSAGRRGHRTARPHPVTGHSLRHPPRAHPSCAAQRRPCAHSTSARPFTPSPTGHPLLCAQSAVNRHDHGVHHHDHHPGATGRRSSLAGTSSPAVGSKTPRQGGPVCCKCMFEVFQTFQKYVAKVDRGCCTCYICCKCFQRHVARVYSKYFIYF